MSAADSVSYNGTSGDSQHEPVRWYQRLRQLFMKRVWYVHPGAHLRVRLSPEQTYDAIAVAARPSVERLHLRAVFARGRRYFLQPHEDGTFLMMTTHKVLWHPRRRTKANAVLTGSFEIVENSVTRLNLHSRIRFMYLLEAFLWPTFMTSILVFMKWPVWIITFFVGALYSLSWIAHRYTAALEAHEMIYFIEKALEDFIPKPAPMLKPKAADLVYESEFAVAWEKFVDEMQDD